MVRRIFTAIAFLCILLAAPALSAHPKIDPFIDVDSLSSQPKTLTINSASAEAADEDKKIEVFIKASDVSAVRELVARAGGGVRVVSGDVMIATVPTSQLMTLADDERVIFIEAAKPVGFSNDVAGSEIGLPEVRLGTGLPTGYTGDGVIIGIVDTGVDFTHPDFLDSEGRSRVLAIWDQSNVSGTSPVEIEDGYGTECDYESIESGSCPLTDVDGHGTHVAGIAAGSDDKYNGVAPGAHIIAVKYDAKLDLQTGYADAIFSTKICEAAYYVFAKAAQYGVPAVVNLSLGTHLGAHDGTSLFEQCLAALVQGQAGRALVAAAGNEYSTERGYTGIHTSFDPEGATKAGNFVIRQKTSDRLYYIDLWGAAGSSLSVGLAVHNGTPTGSPAQKTYLAAAGDKVSGSFFNGKVTYLINATESSSPLNGRPHVGIRIQLGTGVDNTMAYSFDLVVKGTGSFDAWAFPDKPARTIQFTSVEGDVGGDYSYVPGDRVKSLAIPATSPDIIAVAGYASRTSWTASSMEWVFNGQDLGAILNFSSSGPSADAQYTGQKPEISAPGGMIASALSSSTAASSQVITDDGEHFMQAGTSMAAPFVSGAIALMFQQNRNFTQTDVEGFLQQGAYSDSFTGSVPNDRWGSGKLDLLKSMGLAVNGAASGDFAAQGSLSMPSGDSGGSGSCELAVGSAANASSVFSAIAAALVLFAIAWRRTLRLRRTSKRTEGALRVSGQRW